MKELFTRQLRFDFPLKENFNDYEKIVKEKIEGNIDSFIYIPDREKARHFKGKSSSNRN